MSPLPRIADLTTPLKSLGIDVPADARVGAFGDSPESSEELLALIRAGRKRAGAALLWAYEFEHEAVPVPGEVEVVVDHRGAPCLVIRTTEVVVVPFNQVTAAFAAREGEGDGSLAYWRKVHTDFFARECRRIGRQPSETMAVVCCSFEVLAVAPWELPTR
jgi:uncharacterized protein YhfF